MCQSRAILGNFTLFFIIFFCIYLCTFPIFHDAFVALSLSLVPLAWLVSSVLFSITIITYFCHMDPFFHDIFVALSLSLVPLVWLISSVLFSITIITYFCQSCYIFSLSLAFFILFTSSILITNQMWILLIIFSKIITSLKHIIDFLIKATAACLKFKTYLKKVPVMANNTPMPAINFISIYAF